jgi:hypothetical protein
MKSARSSRTQAGFTAKDLRRECPKQALRAFCSLAAIWFEGESGVDDFKLTVAPISERSEMARAGVLQRRR